LKAKFYGKKATADIKIGLFCVNALEGLLNKTALNRIIFNINYLYNNTSM